MADFSVSLHEDDSFNLDHDNRVYCSPNINPEKSCENISYAGNISLRDFYEETFQASYEEYRAKKTKERGKTFTANWPEKYYDSVAQKQAEEDEKLRKAKLDGKHGSELADKKAYTKVAKQIIIQIGNTDDLEAMSPEEQKKTREAMIGALKEYMDTFQKENPNFRIVNAVIHVDEISLAPHLHLTYVPVVEQKRGQHISNSLRGALKQMGFTDQPKTETSPMVHCQTLWQTKERERVIEIAGRHGLDVGYQKGNKGRGQTIGEYRAAKQAEREAQSAELSAKFNETYIGNQETTISENDSTIEKQEKTIKRNEVEIDKQSAELATVKTELSQKSRELEQTDYIADVINETVDRCEKKMMEELAPASSPDGQYERVTKGGMFGKKQTYVMVPEDDYEVLDKRAGLARSYVQKIIKEHIEPLRQAIMQLPVTRRLYQWIDQLRHDVQERDRRIKQLEKDKEKLQEEKTKLEKEVKVADRVLFRKLNLGRGAVQKMKDEASQEIDREQKGRSSR